MIEPIARCALCLVLINLVSPVAVAVAAGAKTVAMTAARTGSRVLGSSKRLDLSRVS